MILKKKSDFFSDILTNVRKSKILNANRKSEIFGDFFITIFENLIFLELLVKKLGR